MSKNAWDSPPDSPTHASDIFGTSEAVAAQPPAPDEVPATDELAAEQPPAPEQAPALQVSMTMQLKHETLKTMFKEAYDQARGVLPSGESACQRCGCWSLTSRSHHACADGPAGRWCVARRWRPRACSSLCAAKVWRQACTKEELACTRAAARSTLTRVCFLRACQRATALPRRASREDARVCARVCLAAVLQRIPSARELKCHALAERRAGSSK